jgi:hypothetical protein
LIFQSHDKKGVKCGETKQMYMCQMVYRKGLAFYPHKERNDGVKTEANLQGAQGQLQRTFPFKTRELQRTFPFKTRAYVISKPRMNIFVLQNLSTSIARWSSGRCGQGVRHSTRIFRGNGAILRSIRSSGIAFSFLP